MTVTYRCSNQMSSLGPEPQKMVLATPQQYCLPSASSLPPRTCISQRERQGLVRLCARRDQKRLVQLVSLIRIHAIYDKPCRASDSPTLFIQNKTFDTLSYNHLSRRSFVHMDTFKPELLQGTNHIAHEEHLNGDLQTKPSAIAFYHIAVAITTHLIAACAIQGPIARPRVAGRGNTVGTSCVIEAARLPD